MGWMNSMRRFGVAFPVVLCSLALLATGGCKRKHRGSTDLAANVQKMVVSPQLAILQWANYSDYQAQVKQFYEAREYALAWTVDGELTAQARAMIEEFDHAALKGLKPQDYDADRWAARVDELARIKKSNDSSADAQNKVAQFDAAMTITAMRYVSDLHSGRVNPQQLNFDIDVPKKRAGLDLAAFLNDQLTEAGDPKGVVAGVEPQNPMYKATLAALPHYIELARNQDAGPPMPLVTVTRPVAPKTRVPAELLDAVTKRLAVDGDLPAELMPPAPAEPKTAEVQSAGAGKKKPGKLRQWLDRKRHKSGGGSEAADAAATEVVTAPRPTGFGVYTPELADAVKKFQARHGLQQDGKLTTATAAALNTPMDMRVLQMDDALERWRWLSDTYEQPRLLVNLPEFVVRAYDANHNLDFKMKVVDGQAEGGHDTPVFTRMMRFLIFRPYWNIPESIIKKEVVPHLQKSGLGYLAQKNFEVVTRDGSPASGYSADDIEHMRFIVREKPGPNNSLGLVKFMFPNEYDVYMHSTPEMNLFNLPRRDRSHGCVRLEHADQMAAWVLQGQGDWDEEKISEAMKSEDKDNVQVSLKTPLPVVVFYLTAIPDEDGTMHFFNDVYGYDAAMNAILSKGMPYPSAPAKINPKVLPGETV